MAAGQQQRAGEYEQPRDCQCRACAGGVGEPVFGNEALLAEIADSPDLATLVGECSRYLWPDSYDLRRIPVRAPAPVYPMSLIWRDDNPHPGLMRLRGYLDSRRADIPDIDVWMPKWGQRSHSRS